jgi:hypothetical protein
MTATRKEVRQMRKFPAALSAALVLAALLATAGGRAATGPAQIRITDVESSSQIIRPQGGGVAGTVEIVHQRLYNARVSRRSIGRVLLTCMFADARTRMCTGTYLLPKGQLVVTGTITTRLLYQIAIIGGTGVYESAHGTLTVTSTHLRPRREVLLFRLAA